MALIFQPYVAGSTVDFKMFWQNWQNCLDFTQTLLIDLQYIGPLLFRSQHKTILS